jgi:uncharacterized membrane protein
MDDHQLDRKAGAPAALWRAVHRIEREPSLDGATRALDRAAGPLGASPAGPVLRGEWLGHALHPLLTDLALGCWTAAGLLDVLAFRSGRKAAQRLVGAGLLFALPTAASGVAEYGTVHDDRTRRVAAVHGGGNVGALLLYVASWNSRRRGHHLRGAAAAMLGGLLAIATGYLGGHLSFVLGAGAGPRGQVTDAIELPPPEAVHQGTAPSNGPAHAPAPEDVLRSSPPSR